MIQYYYIILVHTQYFLNVSIFSVLYPINYHYHLGHSSIWGLPEISIKLATFSWVEHTLSPFLACVALKFLKNISQIFYRISINLGVSVWCFLMIIFRLETFGRNTIETSVFLSGSSVQIECQSVFIHFHADDKGIPETGQLTKERRFFVLLFFFFFFYTGQ